MYWILPSNPLHQVYKALNFKTLKKSQLSNFSEIKIYIALKKICHCYLESPLWLKK